YYALDDARSDILTLCREVQRLSAALAAQPAASAEPSKEECWDLWQIASRSRGFLDERIHRFACDLLNRYGRPAGDAQPFAAPVAAQTADDNDVVYLGGSAPPIPRWVVDSADRIAKYMDANWPGEWALGRIQSRATQKADDVRDAERYRWLRVQPFEGWKRIAWNTWGDDPAVATHRDADIDAAISAQPAANSDLTSFDDYWRRFWALCGRLASQQNKEE